MLLQIRNFAEEDAGVYMCTSTNSLGKIEGSIRLYQIGEINRDYNPTIHGKGESDQNHESVTLIYYPSMIAQV